MKQINKRSFVFVQSVEYVCVNKNTCLLSCFRCKLSVWSASLLILMALLILLRLDDQHLLFLVSSTLGMLAHHFSFFGIDWSTNVVSLSILLLLLLLLLVIVLLLLLGCLLLLLILLSWCLLLVIVVVVVASLALVSPWTKVLIF